jgi:hypothetical protein
MLSNSHKNVLRSLRLIRSSLVCGIALASISTGAAYASKDSVPDWVRVAASAPQGTYPRDTDAVVLLDETTLTVANDGKAVEHRRRVVRILRPSGRDEGVVHVSFDKDAKILSLHVWSIAPDGHEYQMKDSEIGEFGYPGEGGALYDDARYKEAEPPGRDPGGIVAYEYEQREEPYIREATWFFQGSLPHVQQSFTLELPPGYVYKTTWAHHEGSKAIDLEHQRYRWEIDQTPGIDLERVPLRPSQGALAGRMTVHYGPAGDATMGTWQGVGEWYSGLTRDRIVATPDIAAKAQELTAGKTDFYDKTEAIGEFVQKQIRYFVIEMGVGGFQPHPAEDIFKNRYGDCKDKATLLSAMLSSVGIHSDIMIVDTARGVIDPQSPSIHANHAIGAIEIPEGYQSPKLRSVVTAKSGKRYLIFDPTWEMTPFGQLEHNLQGSYGVLMEGERTEIVQLPLLSPELNTVRRTANLQLAADGSLKGSVVEKRFGDLSEERREMYTQGDAKEQSTYLDHVLSHDFVSFAVSDVKVENAASLNKDFTTSFQIAADRYARNAGPLLMVRPRVLGSAGLNPDREPRLFPIDLKQTLQETDDFTIQLPDGYISDEVPDPVKLDVGFASYESATKLDGNALHYTRTYTVRQVSLPANRYSDVQKLADAIAADEQNRAVLKKK